MKTTSYVLELFLVCALAVTSITLLGASFSSAQAKEKDVVTLTADNTLLLNGAVDGDSVGEILEKAQKLDKAESTTRVLGVLKRTSAPEPIYLFLNTPGGSIQSGMELVEGLNGLHRPVYTITSFSASMGMQIAQSLEGERLILKHGIMMSHQGIGEFQGQFGGLEPSQAYNRYRIWVQRMKEMDQQTVERSKGKQTLESYQKAYNHELWVTGSEAVAQGYADRLVKIRCDKTLSGATSHTIQFMGLPITYDTDDCPINTSPHNIRIELSTNYGPIVLAEFKKHSGILGVQCSPGSGYLCAMDASLSYEKIDDIRSKFVKSFDTSRSNVIPMAW